MTKSGPALDICALTINHRDSRPGRERSSPTFLRTLAAPSASA
jgi:hypothetical protein